MKSYTLRPDTVTHTEFQCYFFRYDSLLQNTSRGCPPLDLVEMPRLKLTFTAKPDQDGTLRLFSMDHANLFVSNDRDPRVTKLIAGIPHSLIMSTAQGEMSILVSVWKVARPRVGSQVRRVSCGIILSTNESTKLVLAIFSVATNIYTDPMEIFTFTIKYSHLTPTFILRSLSRRCL